MSVPGMAELARQARAGDEDAALLFARRSDPGLSFCEFKDQIVPDGALTPELFNVLADSFDQVAEERRGLADTVEIAIPDSTG